MLRHRQHADRAVRHCLAPMLPPVVPTTDSQGVHDAARCAGPWPVRPAERRPLWDTHTC